MSWSDRQSYSDSENTTILSMRRAGAKFQEIADAVNRPSAACVRLQYAKLTRVEQGPPIPRRVERRCMTCTRPFMSEGNHNRMCEECRAGARDLSPLAMAFSLGHVVSVRDTSGINVSHMVHAADAGIQGAAAMRAR